MTGYWAIKKDGKYVKNFSDGKKLTVCFYNIERYTNKKSAEIVAREYGRKNGKGYTVVEFA